MNRPHQHVPWFRNFWLIVGLAAVAALAAGGLARETLRNRQVDYEIAALRAEATSLQARNFELLGAVANLDSPDALERTARLNFNLRKEGERVVVLHSPTPSSDPLAQAPRESWSNPRKWWSYFTDRPAYDEYLQAAQAEL